MEKINNDVENEIFNKYEHLGFPNEVQVKTVNNSDFQKGGDHPREPFVIKPVKVLPKKYLEYS